MPTGSNPYAKTPHGKGKAKGDAAAIVAVSMEQRPYDFFINHCQKSGADQCASLGRLLQARGFSVWRWEQLRLRGHGIGPGREGSFGGAGGALQEGCACKGPRWA